MKRAPWLYTLMQIALWSIHGVLISYAQRYLAGMGMRDSAIGLLLGGATAAGFVLQPLLAAVCDRSRLTVRLTLLTGGGLMLLCCAALLPAAKSSPGKRHCEGRTFPSGFCAAATSGDDHFAHLDMSENGREPSPRAFIMLPVSPAFVKKKDARGLLNLRGHPFFFSRSYRSFPRKNRATVPGPEWAPITGPI